MKKRLLATMFEQEPPAPVWVPPEIPPLTFTPPTPKLAVIGYAGHGKDTLCEILQEEYGLTSRSSSYSCAFRAIWPLMTSSSMQDSFINWLVDEVSSEYFLFIVLSLRCLMAKGYGIVEAYEKRSAYRPFWHQALRWYTKDDKARISREILANFDIHNGIRDLHEFQAARQEGLFDLAIWVDASDRLPPEPIESCTVTPAIADVIINNNGTLEELRANAIEMAEFLYPSGECTYEKS